MNSTKTLLMVLVFGALLSLYLWNSVRLQDVAEQQEASSRLLTVKSSELTEIKLEHPDMTIALNKVDGVWNIISPFSLLADDRVVQILLEQLDRTKKTDLFTPSEIKPFGLEKPSLKAEFKAGNVPSQTFEFGDYDPSGSEVYARKPAAKSIFTIADGLYRELIQDLNTFRDKRLLPVDMTDATSITLICDGVTWALEKRGVDEWMLVQPQVMEADSARIKEMLRQWSMARAEDFIDTTPLNLESLGLDKPILTATVSVPQDQATFDSTDAASSQPLSLRVTMLVGDMAPPSTDTTTPSAEERCYTMQKGANYACIVDQSVINMLIPTYDDLRAKQLFTFTSEALGKVEFDVLSSEVQLARDFDGQWRFAGVDTSEKLNQGKVLQILEELLQIEASRFFDDASWPTSSTVTGIDAPILRAVGVSRDGLATQTLMTGKQNPEENFVYAIFESRTSESTSTMKIGIDSHKPGRFFITRDDLLDRAMFTFDPSKISKVEWIDGDQVLTLINDGISWKASKDDGQNVSLTPDQAINLVYAVSSLTWSKKLDPVYPNDAVMIQEQLTTTTKALMMFGEKDQTPWAQLDFGGMKNSSVYLRSDGNACFAIDKDRYEAITRAISTIEDTLKKEILTKASQNR